MQNLRKNKNKKLKKTLNWKIAIVLMIASAHEEANQVKFFQDYILTYLYE